jgi:hypothetical protein
MLHGALNGIRRVADAAARLMGWGATPIDLEEPKLERHPDVPKTVMQAVKRSYDVLQPYRVRQEACVDEIMGRWKTSAEMPKMLLNPVRTFKRVYSALLTGGEPQALIQARYPKLRPFALKMQIALNNQLRECQFATAVENAVGQSLMSVGILKTMLAMGGPKFEWQGAFYDPGKAYSDSINIQHFAIDHEAYPWHEATYIADRYQVPVTWLKELKEKGEDAVLDKLESSIMRPEFARLSAPEDPDKRLYKMGWAWDVYLPQQNLLCVYDNESDEEPLLSFQYDGPETGCYDLIIHEDAAGHPLGSPSIISVEPLAKAITTVAAKLQNQAERQKTNPVYDRNGNEDAKVWDGAKDGAPIGFYNADAVREFRSGGADPANQQFLIWAIQQMENEWGLRTLMGSQAMSETVGQDELLHGSANKLVDAMRSKILRATRGAMRKHLWYLWSEPFRQFEGSFEIPGTGIAHRFVISPEVREGDFLDFNLDLVPHSMVMRTPEQQAQQVQMFWQTVILPNAQLFMQSGKMPNAEGVAARIAELLDINMDDFLVPVNPGAAFPEKPGMAEAPAMPRPPVTRRINERISRPGHTAEGNDAAMMESLSRMAASKGAAG